MSKMLYLVRHAKSSWDDMSLDDRDRPLSKRGLRNAPKMGRRLSKRGIALDRMIVSPALRAQTTARLIAAEIGFDQENIDTDDTLYFNGSTIIANLIRDQDESVRQLMLVGHNPDTTSLFNMLCGFQVANMPTCAIASIKITMPWSELSATSSDVHHYDYPKKDKDDA